ncbi:MAG: hypothetical protein ABW185_17455 [Sedimenticola sp.]
MSMILLVFLVAIHTSGMAAESEKVTGGELEVSNDVKSFEGSVGFGGGGAGLKTSLWARGLRRFVLCVDGLKLLQTVGPTAGGAWGNGAGFNLNPSVSTIQLYEERGGKVVPVRCK